MPGTEDALTVYADYVCPFCYLGWVSLESVRKRRDVRTDWRPFDLRRQKRDSNGEINHSIDDGKDEAYYAQVRQNVERLQEAYGAEQMVDLSVVRRYDSLNAQMVSLYVKREYPDRWHDFDAEVYTSLWEEGRDIGDIDVLTELAATVAIKPDEIHAVLEDTERRDELEGLFEDSRRAGVSGVPTFAYDGRVARGAVSPERLEALLDGT